MTRTQWILLAKVILLIIQQFNKRNTMDIKVKNGLLYRKLHGTWCIVNYEEAVNLAVTAIEEGKVLRNKLKKNSELTEQQSGTELSLKDALYELLETYDGK